MQVSPPSSSEPLPVALVNMPFGVLMQPSIGLALLKGAVRRQDVRARIFHYSLRFARQVGVTEYLSVTARRTVDLAGEWMFSEALFGPDPERDAGYVDEVLRKRMGASDLRPLPEASIDAFFSVRAQVDAFLEGCVEDLLAARPTIVGFTSLFQQHAASLALAKRLKSAAPGLYIVFGGANCEGEMGQEVIRQFDFVDAVVSGEADLVFPQLVSAVLAGEAPDNLPGVVTSVSLERGVTPNRPVRDMDALPYVNYDDYFDQVELYELGKEVHFTPRLLYETSRGCWWGEKNHCTFCGLNGGGMVYRSKSADRALGELVSIAERYPGLDVGVVDNILDMGYFKDFIPELIRLNLGLDLFYETKSNLKKDHLLQMREAGITAIQPGVESLSTHVLSLMRKGVRAIYNVQLLKWCEELSIRPFWNVLWGFPGERVEDYEHTTALVPLLNHLSPPLGTATIRLDRFSPNFERAAEHGFVNVQPYPSYKYVYPLDADALHRLAYYFTFEYAEERDVDSYTAPARDAILAWHKAKAKSGFFYVPEEERLILWDLRPGARSVRSELHGLDRQIYEACDGVNNPAQIAKGMSSAGEDTTVEDVQRRLDRMVERQLMMREGNAYLALALPVGLYQPSPQMWAQARAKLLHGTRHADAYASDRRRLGEPRPLASALERAADPVTAMD